MDKQRSTKHTHETKDRVTQTPLKTGGELRCSGRVSSSWSTSGTRRDNLVTNPVIRWMRKGPGNVYDKWNNLCLSVKFDNLSFRYVNEHARLLEWTCSFTPISYFTLS